MSKKAGSRVGASMEGKRSLIDGVILHLVKMCRVVFVDTQAIRKKLLDQLDELFQLAISIAKGKVKHFRDDKGKMHPVTSKQRKKWARIAAYAAQVMTNLAKGFDEKQFQADLKKLEEMVEEVKREQAGKRDPSVVCSTPSS